MTTSEITTRCPHGYKACIECIECKTMTTPTVEEMVNDILSVYSPDDTATDYQDKLRRTLRNILTHYGNARYEEGVREGAKLKKKIVAVTANEKYLFKVYEDGNYNAIRI